MAKTIPRISITLPNGAADAVRMSSPSSISPSGNQGVYQGLLCLVKVVTPAFNTTPCATTIRIYDRNGILLWTSAALARSSGAAGYALVVDIPISSGEYVTAQPSVDPTGAGGIVTIDLDYIPDHF